ncbi:MAG: hypothetical protein K2X29_11190 [Candidatus Obscuribacterales bacterium]|nr:hypothetical protein [Candidatus Obscuribacterales bacterium]
MNKALIILGKSHIASDTLFNSGIIDADGNLTTKLDKYQQQTVTTYDIFHSAFAMTMNKPFMYRRFQFNTQIGVAKYKLDSLIFEGLRANSFFNVTVGGGGNRISVLPYEKYNEMYADPNTVPTGRPFYLFPFPADGSDECEIILSPLPDQVYVIEGQSRFLVEPLKEGSDPCAFPFQYEHMLLMKIVEFMEGRLNEGREVSIHQFAEQFIGEVLRDACGAVEEVDAFDPGLRLYGGGYCDSARDYNPLTDAAGPYP